MIRLRKNSRNRPKTPDLLRYSSVSLALGKKRKILSTCLMTGLRFQSRRSEIFISKYLKPPGAAATNPSARNEGSSRPPVIAKSGARSRVGNAAFCGDGHLFRRTAPHRRFRSPVIPDRSEAGLMLRKWQAFRGKFRAGIGSRAARVPTSLPGLRDSVPTDPRDQDRSQDRGTSDLHLSGSHTQIIPPPR